MTWLQLALWAPSLIVGCVLICIFIANSEFVEQSMHTRNFEEDE